MQKAHPYVNYFTGGKAELQAKSLGLIWAAKNPTMKVGFSRSEGVGGGLWY